MRSAVSLRRFALPAAVALAVGLAAALASRAVWWAPLNVDEELTRRVATEPFGSIFHIVSSERGGGPLHFWIEHFTLQWPGGLVGLRGPSTLFFLLTLPAVALIARELAGSFAAVAAVLLTATAPLAISYSTFGRPHAPAPGVRRVGHVGRAPRCEERQPARLVPRRRHPRLVGVRASDRAGVLAHRVRRGAALRAPVAARGRARGLAGRRCAHGHVRPLLPEDAARPERAVRRRVRSEGTHVQRPLGLDGCGARRRAGPAPPQLVHRLCDRRASSRSS